jgi:hypothetical protein
MLADQGIGLGEREPQIDALHRPVGHIHVEFSVQGF